MPESNARVPARQAGHSDAVAYPEMNIPHGGLFKVVVYSFGYLHEAGIPGRITGERPEFVVDVRNLFRDPHCDPSFRQLTGRDDAVRARVLDQAGAIEFVQMQAATVASLIPSVERATQRRLLRVAIGCAGGRHRSVVLAESLAILLNQRDIGAEITHVHIRRPVVNR
jgi:RNase adaptor protein for sRNA GlmZ degradation